MRVRTRPRPGRLRLNRASMTSHSAWIVSPAKTGFSTLSSICRKARPVCCIVDCTSRPSEGVDQCGRRQAQPDVRFMREEFAIGEQYLDHAGAVDEINDVGLGDRAADGLELP